MLDAGLPVMAFEAEDRMNECELSVEVVNRSI